MPMYDEGYSRGPSEKELADKKVQDHYAEFIEREQLFKELDRVETEYKKERAKYELAVALEMISETDSIDVKEYLDNAEKQIITARLIIEQLHRASRGEAYGRRD